MSADSTANHLTVENCIERFVGDESWQDFLIDDERSQLMEAIQRRLEKALEAEYTRLKGRLRTINLSMGNLEGPQRANMFRVLLQEYGL